MARYYSVILGINVFIGLFYFYMRRKWGISPKTFLWISAASIFTGMIFPVVLGHSNLMMAVVANALLIGIGAYYITGLISDKGSDSAVEVKTPEPFDNPIDIQVDKDIYDSKGIEEPKEEPKEEPIEEPIVGESLVEATKTLEEEAVPDETAEEESLAEAVVTLEEEAVPEETAEEESLAEAVVTLEEEVVPEETAEEESLAEAVVTLEEEAVPEETAEEESLTEAVVTLEEEAVPEETAEEESLAEAVVTLEEEVVPEETPEEESLAEAVATLEEEAVPEEVIAEEAEFIIMGQENLLEEPRIPWEAETINHIQGVETMSVVNNLSTEENYFELRDSYIMRGFDAKAEGKLELAVKYFSSALELNPPSDLEFLLIIDICAMLEELGQYRRAQENLEQFKYDRPDLSEDLLQQLVTMQKTLEILQEILTKANTPNMPLSKLPALIRVSVEEKVNQWKNEVSQL